MGKFHAFTGATIGKSSDGFVGVHLESNWAADFLWGFNPDSSNTLFFRARRATKLDQKQARPL